jgi:hypothetical protein
VREVPLILECGDLSPLSEFRPYVAFIEKKNSHSGDQSPHSEIEIPTSAP